MFLFAWLLSVPLLLQQGDYNMKWNNVSVVKTPIYNMFAYTLGIRTEQNIRMNYRVFCIAKPSIRTSCHKIVHQPNL